MEYEFEVIHREGKLNIADALSRIIINEDQITQNQNQKAICLVKTRAKTRQEIQELKQNAQESAEKPKTYKKYEHFHIDEKRNYVMESKEYDHIVFVIDKTNCRLHKQMQFKLKKLIVIDSLAYGEIFSITQDKSVIKIPTILHDTGNKIHAENSVKTLMMFLAEKGFERVAINVDIRDSLSYLELRKIIRKWFRPTQISITIYLNQVITVTDPHEINKILVQFHDTLQACHVGWNRMYSA